MSRVPNVRTHAWLDRAVDIFWTCVGVVGDVFRVLTGADE